MTNRKIDIPLMAKQPEPCASGCCTPAQDQQPGELTPDSAEQPDALRALRKESFALTQLDCADCAVTIERGVARLPGVQDVTASFAASKLSVAYNAAQLNRRAIIRRVEELGYGVSESDRYPGQSNVLAFTVTGMDCADCATNIERQVARLPGVRGVNVNFMTTKLAVEADQPSSVFAARIQQAVRDAGYRATPVMDTRAAAEPQRWWQRHAKLLPMVLAAGLWAIGFSLSFTAALPVVIDALYGAAIVVGGYRIARSGYYALVRGRTIGIDLLMTIAVIGAAAIGEWSEGAAVVVLFALGNVLESLTTDKARNAIRALMDLSPREAVIKTPDGEQRVPVEALMPGDVVVIRPGEQVSADGRVVSGSTTVNQAAITGESLPVAKSMGDEVFAGTLNERGFIEVAVTKRADDSTLAKIIHLVEEAQSTKAPAQRFVDRFAAYYTPAVMVLAVLIATLPPLLGAPFLPWLERALVLLVIACPCALVISTPVAIVAGIGRASRSGVLIKGGAYLEAIGGIRTIAFDKTGTLTHGRPTVTDVVPLAELSPDAVLALAAAVESRSEHPLAGAILRSAQERGLSYVQPEQFEALTGRGAQATVDGLPVVIGSPALFSNPSDPIRTQLTAFQAAGKTALLVGRGEQPIGIIAVADQVRAGADQVIRQLNMMDVHTVMLTGDNRHTAAAVARRLGLDDIKAELLPEHKTDAIKALLAARGGVAMIGDGVNDAPALATATVGIAMGAAGSDTALETADVALMADDLSKLPYLIGLSRAALRTIRTNVAFSLVVKVIFLALTLAGYANLWLAILADTGAALIVIANGMRLLRFQDRRGTEDDRRGIRSQADHPRKLV